MWNFHIDNGMFLHMMLFQNTVRTELCTDCNNADFEQDAYFMRKRYHAGYIYMQRYCCIIVITTHWIPRAIRSCAEHWAAFPFHGV